MAVSDVQHLPVLITLTRGLHSILRSTLIADSHVLRLGHSTHFVLPSSPVCAAIDCDLSTNFFPSKGISITRSFSFLDNSYACNPEWVKATGFLDKFP